MRIAVTGSRDWGNSALLRAILTAHRPVNLHVGDCPTGADRMARDWGRDEAYALHIYEANWGKLGLSAGPIRNRDMLDQGKPELVIAFKQREVSKGTDDCIKAARERNIPVLIVLQTGS